MIKHKDTLTLLVHKAREYCGQHHRGNLVTLRVIRIYDDKHYALKICNRLNRKYYPDNEDPAIPCAFTFDIETVDSVWMGP